MEGFIESKESLLKYFGSDPEKGLTEKLAENNREIFGKNIFARQKPELLWKRIWSAATEPMIIMLIAAGMIALAVNVFRSVSNGEADFLECVGVFAAIALSVAISVVMEGKSAKAFEALSEISSNIVVKVVREGKTIMLEQENIVAGDIILLSTGDKIPADGRLLESSGLAVDESALTGESHPAEKNAEIELTAEDIPLAERVNMLYSGTYITDGNGKMLVTSVGDNTEFGKIAFELGATAKNSTPLQEKLARLGKTITVLGVIAASVVFISQVVSFLINGELNTENIMESFVTSIVLIVAAVPEGLPTIVAVSLSVNIIKLSKQNALVKKMIASETIGCVNVICSDKTGTLTENKMAVRGFFDSKWHDDITELSSEWLTHNICLNTTADIAEDGSFIGNPSECAMLNFYECSGARQNSGNSYKCERNEHDNICVFTFSSDLKHMTTVSDVDGRMIAYVKGSPECIFEMCSMEPLERKKAEQCIIKVQKKAMRVIAFAHKEIFDIGNFEDEVNHRQLESNMTFDGFVAISDPLRRDVYDAVKSCRRAGVSLKILTGDNIVTASAIAHELHLLGGENTAVEAAEIDRMTDDELSKKLPFISVIARSTPTVKMRIVNILKQDKNVVAVTGDGINDAPALKNADVGIAMGISGTEVSKEASDIILLDDSFSAIVKAIEWGRNIYENFKRFVSFQLTVNLASVIVVFASVLLGLKAPFTALELLWINIIMDGPPALTLGLEPDYDDLMERRPVKRGESIISGSMIVRIVAAGGYMSFVFLAQYVFNFLNAPSYQMHTVLFTLFVLFQLFNAFNCRELHSESIFRHLLKNKLMLLVVGCTFFLQICIIQFAGAFFGTVPLDLQMWIKLFIVSVSVIVLSEFVKLLFRQVEKS